MILDETAPDNNRPKTYLEEVISQFYRSIYVPKNLLVLAVFKDGLKKPPTHYFYDNIEDFLRAAFYWNAQGKNVYHGCAGYLTNNSRKGENVGGAFAIWIDGDVGPNKPYATQRDAAMHIEQFRIALALPLSSIVSSGSGVHVYWHFEKPLSPDQWKQLTALFAAVLDKYGIKHDSSRTTDIASILRIPGTSNFKTDPAKAVTLKRQGESAPVGEFYKKLKAFADANGIIVRTSKVKPMRKSKMAMAYEPNYAEFVTVNCAVLREVADTGGDVPYGIWWPAMGAAKFLVDGEKVAAHWTRNRAATGHSNTDLS